MGADTVSHKIFQVYPDPTDRFRRLENCHLEAVSRWVFTSLLDVCEKNEADGAARLYRQLSGTVALRLGLSVRKAGIELLEWHP
jgi:hypothetical protein